MKYVKIPSRDSAPYSATNNRVRFTIPEGNYDLSKSYFLFYSQINLTGGSADAIYDVSPVYSETGNGYAGIRPALPNYAFVRNCKMRTSKNAKLSEDIRRVDSLRTNLQPYTRSSTELELSELESVFSGVDKYNRSNNCFIRKNHLGSQKSQYLEAPVIVPFDLFESGKGMYSSDNGDIDVTLELNLNKIQLATTTIPGPPPVVHVSIEPLANEFNILTIGNGTTDASGNLDNLTITSQVLPDNIEAIPYYVGQQVRVQSATATSDETVIITNINYNTSTNLVSLTFDGNIVNGGTASSPITDFNLSNPDTPNLPTSGSLTVNYAEVVMYNLMDNKPQQPKVLSTWSTEEVTLGGTITNYQRVFDVEPNAVNAFFVLTDNDMTAQPRGIDKFRIRVNNEDVTDRDVNVNDNGALAATTGNNIKSPEGLYYTSLLDTFTNMGLRFVNMNERIKYLGDKTGAGHRHSLDKSRLKLSVVPVPLFVSNQYKLVQINVDCSTTAGHGFNKVILFKQVIRQL